MPLFIQTFSAAQKVPKVVYLQTMELMEHGNTEAIGASFGGYAFMIPVLVWILNQYKAAAI